MLFSGAASEDLSIDSNTLFLDVSTNRVGVANNSPSVALDVTGEILSSSHIRVGGSNNELRFYEGANYVGFESPALSADQIWVLPSADGSANQLLKTDGSGNLSWATDGSLTDEELQDKVGAMFGSNTETGITATYQDGDGTIDLVVGTLNQNTTGTAATVTGAAQTAITSVGTLTTLTVDDITINGSTISDGGYLTIDAAGAISLDADDEGEIRLYDGGTQYATLKTASNGLKIQSIISDADISFVGNDGGSTITALTLDMSDAGTANFGHDIKMVDNAVIRVGTGNDLSLFHDASNSHITNDYGVLYIDQRVNDGNLIIRCDDQSGGLAEYIALDGGSGIVNMKQKTRVLTASPTILELETTNSSSYKFYIENRYDASNTVNFVWNTTTLMRFTSNYNCLALMPGNDPGVAIGTYDDEGHKLNIYRGSSGNATMKIKTSSGGDPEIHLDSGAANRNAMIKFFDQGTHSGRIDYHHDGNKMQFQAGSSTGASFEILNGQMLSNGIFQMTGDNPLQFDGGRYFRFQRDSNALHLKRGDTLAHIGTFSDNGAYAAVSDERLKDNINTIAGATSKVKQLRGVTHTWKPKLQDPDNPTAISYGLIAQEVEAVIPEVVKTAENEDGYKAVAYDNLVPLLIETIKELEARITILEG